MYSILSATALKVCLPIMEEQEDGGVKKSGPGRKKEKKERGGRIKHKKPEGGKGEDRERRRQKRKQ